MKFRNIIISLFFLAVIAFTAVDIRCYKSFGNMIYAVLDACSPLVGTDDTASEQSASAKLSASLNAVSEGIINDLHFKNDMIELNSIILKGTGTRTYYDNPYGINITTDGYVVSKSDYTDTDYEFEQISAFKEWLDEKDINLLYVNEPAKYIDDSYFYEEFGSESYMNRNVDLFLDRIDRLGINYVDLRDEIRNSGNNPLSYFYKTDHHWTVPTAKWAAELVARELNNSFDYNIDLSLYDDSEFCFITYSKSWLGEQGKKVGESYLGLDDYTMVEPKYDTSYLVFDSDDKIIQEGNFSIFIDKGTYANSLPHESPSWHYSYKPYELHNIHNNNVDYGKVLVLGDSYEYCMLPFLTLGIKDVELVVMRGLSGSIRDLIENGNYDTVIIAYAQFMVGAHDNIDNANYRMFTLD